MVTAGAEVALKSAPSLSETATFQAESTASTMYWTFSPDVTDAVPDQLSPSAEDKVISFHVEGWSASVYRTTTSATASPAADGVVVTAKFAVVPFVKAFEVSIVAGA